MLYIGKITIDIVNQFIDSELSFCNLDYNWTTCGKEYSERKLLKEQLEEHILIVKEIKYIDIT